MSKVFKVIGVIAGAVALVATGVGAFAAAGSALAATATKVATWAALAAGVANVGATLLAKPPPARGSVTQVIIGPDPPAPYVMGEGLVGGVLRHDTAYGATLNKVPNPYRWMVMVLCAAGPVQSLSPRMDQEPIGSWYSGFAYTDTKLGTTPDTALTPYFSGAPGWSTSSKLSGKACIGWNLKFDKDGKRFASGVPQLGGYGQWVKVYDPRLDSTQPGGSGACRAGTESTYVWSENPALHAATYALGRAQNGKRVMGIGLPADAIDWVNVAAWANVCDANGWTVFGRVFEPGDRFANLREICIAGGAEPILTSGKLRFHYAAPRVALDTVTAADLVEGEDQEVTAQQTWASRLNTVFPRYVSPDHKWEQVQAEAVQVASYLTEDGEVKQAEWPFNLVKDKDQAAQLAAYRLVDSRELPIVLRVTARLRHYRPGDCLELDLLEELGVDGPAVILKRSFDPTSMVTTLHLQTETAAKHDYALGRTGVAPPTPALGQTAQQRDELAFEAINGRGAYRITAQSVAFPLTSDDDQIDIATFSATLDDGRTITLPAGSLTGLASSTVFGVFYSLSAGTYSAVVEPATSAMADPDKVFLAWQATSALGTFPTPDPPPDGWFGGGGNWNQFPTVAP